MIRTERLTLRDWRDSDLAPWAAMNADPQVRQYLGPLLTYEQSAARVLNYQDKLDRYEWGFWALEVRASGEFIGFTDWTQWTMSRRSPASAADPVRGRGRVQARAPC